MSRRGRSRSGRAAAAGVVATAMLLGPGTLSAAPDPAAPLRAAGAPEVAVVAEGLEVPWDIAFLPDGRALVTERPGRVQLLDADLSTPPRRVAKVPVAAEGEGGLLGVAVDPAYGPAAPFVYLLGTVGGRVEVQRWRFLEDRLEPDGVVLDSIVAGRIHDSGRLRFGPDAHLYVTTGDAGDGARSQDPRSLNGKVLRIPPAGYRGTDADAEVVALGLRNPQGLAWQPGSERLYVTDHGPTEFDGSSGDDELNRIIGGGNYGWPLVRGTDHGPYAAPAHLWRKTIAPSGLAFVRLPGSTWTGDALVAALAGKELRRLDLDGAAVVGDEVLFDGTYGRLRAVTEAPDGSVWVTTSNRDSRGTPGPGDDRVLRILPPAAPPAASPAPGAGRGAVGATGPRPRLRTGRGGTAPEDAGTGEAGISLSVRQLLINQRIAQAALRRLDVIRTRVTGRPPATPRVRWLPTPVTLTVAQLRINQRIARTALVRHAALAARVTGRSPRTPTQDVGDRGVIDVSRRQLLINQRIAQVAVRRVNALERASRLPAGAGRAVPRTSAPGAPAD